MSDERVREAQLARIGELETAVQTFLTLWNSPANTWLASTVSEPIQRALAQLAAALNNQRMGG